MPTPRLRSIKPQFIENRELAQLSIPARHLLILSWTLSDDFGVVNGDLRWLKNHLFPYDAIKSSKFLGWVEELIGAGYFQPFEYEGTPYFKIKDFGIQQRVDKPNHAYRNPACPPELEDKKPAVKRATLKKQRDLPAEQLPANISPIAIVCEGLPVDQPETPTIHMVAALPLPNTMLALRPEAITAAEVVSSAAVIEIYGKPIDRFNNKPLYLSQQDFEELKQEGYSKKEIDWALSAIANRKDLHHRYGNLKFTCTQWIDKQRGNRPVEATSKAARAITVSNEADLLIQQLYRAEPGELN